MNVFFQLPDGEPVTHWYDQTESPRIGETVDLEITSTSPVQGYLVEHVHRYRAPGGKTIARCTVTPAESR